MILKENRLRNKVPELEESFFSFDHECSIHNKRLRVKLHDLYEGRCQLASLSYEKQCGQKKHVLPSRVLFIPLLGCT